MFKRMILFICIMSALTQAGLVLYTPALPEMSQIFQVNSVAMKMTLTSYMLGFGLSQLFYGPISDRVGRKKVLLCAIVIFSLGCLWSIFTISYHGLLTSRFIQGVGAGSCMTLSRAILRDCFDGKDYIYAASFLSAGFALGLGLTPVIGGYLLHYFSWQAEFILLFAMGVVLLFAFSLFLPETYVPKQPKPPLTIFLLKTLMHSITIMRNYTFFAYLLGGVMAYGVVIAYTTMAPFLLQRTMGYSASDYGWFTLLIALAYYLSTDANRRLMHYLSTLQIMKLGLSLIIIAGVMMLIPQLFFHRLNIYLVIIPLMIATYGQAFIWSNSVALALKNLSPIAGTAAAVFSCLQMVISAILSAILATLPESTQAPLALAIIILGVISLFIFGGTVFKPRKP